MTSGILSQTAVSETAEKVLSWRGGEGQLVTYLYQLLEEVWGKDTVLTQYPCPNPSGPRKIAIDLWSPPRKVLVEVKAPQGLVRPKELTQAKEQVRNQIAGLRKREISGNLTAVLTDGFHWYSKLYRQGKTPWRKHQILSATRLVDFLDGLGLGCDSKLTRNDLKDAMSGSLVRRNGTLMKRCTVCNKVKKLDGFYDRVGKPMDKASNCRDCHLRAMRRR